MRAGLGAAGITGTGGRDIKCGHRRTDKHG